jgi:hypothetical protein
VGLSFRRRLVAIAAASATFITGNIGVAMAADQAAPGDLLFGLDRAYEQLGELVGFSDDHSQERLDEAARLADSGRSDDALTAVIRQLQALSDDQDDKNIDASGLDTAIAAITQARDRTHEVGNETAAAASSDAKQIVTQAHAIAAALQGGDREAAREALKNLLDTLKADRGQGNAFGREQNKGQGQPPDDPGNGGGQGNSGQAP